MEVTETFLQLPLNIDPASKAITSNDASLTSELDDLNRLHRTLLSLETPVPGPPAPVKQQRSNQIAKLRDSGNTSFKKGQFSDAIKMYDLAIRMAADRPTWEASGLVREELSVLYGNRAQAMMSQQEWAEASVDAEISVDLKRVGNVKGWWRRGQALKEMGRLDEAADWIAQGLEYERAGPEKQNVGELEALRREISKALERA